MNMLRFRTKCFLDCVFILEAQSKTQTLFRVALYDTGLFCVHCDHSYNLVFGLDDDVFSACFHPDLLFVLFLQLLAVRPDAGSRGLYGRPGSVPQKRL